MVEGTATDHGLVQKTETFTVAKVGPLNIALSSSGRCGRDHAAAANLAKRRCNRRVSKTRRT